MTRRRVETQFCAGGHAACDAGDGGESQFSSGGRDACDAGGDARCSFLPAAMVHMTRGPS